MMDAVSGLWIIVIRLLLSLSIPVSSSGDDVIRFRIGLNSTVEVRGAGSEWRPLCADSFQTQYGQEACAEANYGSMRLFSRYQYSTTVDTVAVSCPSRERCILYKAPACRLGVSITCSLKYCAQDEVATESKCMRVSQQAFPNYDGASEWCRNLGSEVASLDALFDLADVVEGISRMYPHISSSAVIFTSAVRRGYDGWFWESGLPVSLHVQNDTDGRCLAILRGQPIAVECHHSAHVLCESKRACRASILSQNRTLDGQPCVKWNDPAVLHYGNVTTDQQHWNHNLCQTLESREHESVCFVAPNHLKTCEVLPPICPALQPRRFMWTRVNEAPAQRRCAVDEVQCGTTAQCISSDFICDYERDCLNGFDEIGCEDWLAEYDLLGAFKLSNEVLEIWTHIPHAQACARRCTQSRRACESFSYEQSKQLCLLSATTADPRVLTHRQGAQYYQHRFVAADWLLHRLTQDGEVLVSRGGEWAPICTFSYPVHFLTSLCFALRYG